MKYLIIFSLMLSSCSPQKRLARIIQKNPQLLETYIDTVLIDTVIYIDTSLTIEPDTASFTFNFDLLDNRWRRKYEDSLRSVYFRRGINNEVDVQVVEKKRRINVELSLPLQLQYTNKTERYNTSSNNWGLYISLIIIMIVIWRLKT